MGLLDRIRAKAPTSPPPSQVSAPDRGTVRLLGGFAVNVVGESFDDRQASLESIVGGKSGDSVDVEVMACLVPDPRNQYDPNAVRVEINGLVVGNLPRDAAAGYQPVLLRRGALRYECAARIVGGWDRGEDTGSFGVVLDLASPEGCLP